MSTATLDRQGPRVEETVHRTLVVDDVGDLRELYRHILELTGRFEVVGEAADGSRAVELAGRLHPDLIILDVSLPERDGIEILPDLLARAPDATVVMVSGFEARRLAPLALERGAVAFLEKGITPDRLVAELLRALGADPEEADSEEADPEGADPDAERETPAAPASSQPEDITPEELLSFVAHEIRNPLSVVQGFADTMAFQVEDLAPDEIRHLCDRIAANARYLDGIVSSVLQLRAISQGELLLERETVAADRLLPDLVAQLRTEVPEVRIELRLADDLPAVIVDPARIRQVLTNLVGNAAKHSPRDGTVRIEVTVEGRQVAVAVQDEGPGIPEADRERVFDRFVRLDRGAAGLGLGLFISRALVAAMGGSIRVADSEVGARVVVRLPADGAGDVGH